ncbi:MAG: alkaline phosphatase family protein [Anaerolineae bacterium]|nr:alkaline phosphatase family protein [Anaerolineae bacterium]
MTKNILFIMCDQLRWDYLSCYGHPHLPTPNIDRLAEQGVRFSRAYCQAPLCGPSRASFYSGRYMSSHGVLANDDPPRPGEKLLGHYLQASGVRTALIGKSGVKANLRALERLQIDPQSAMGQSLIQGGFEVIMRDDGIHPDPLLSDTYAYNHYLRKLGYDPVNPWDRNANSAVDAAGNRLSGWQMRYAREPADIAEEHSETAYTTDQALQFLAAADPDVPWCLHLSYNKPHWPYVAPAPYHALFGPDQVLSAQRHEGERVNPHPVFEAFMAQDYSRNFSRDEVRETVIPTYMGLIKQIDDHLGRLFAALNDQGLMDTTLIVFTSDHGDYLGDHWLGEKDLFHEPSVRIPLIIYDPDPAADATRGTVDDRFVEAIDLLPTFVEFAGGDIEPERLEGRSLLSLLRNETLLEPWRDGAISEIDYSDRGPRTLLNRHPYDCRAYMVRTDRWKYILYEGFRPQLFDLQEDPQEYVDLGDHPDYEAIRREHHERLFTWLRRRRIRTEMPTGRLFGMGPEADERVGIMIGHW